LAKELKAMNDRRRRLGEKVWPLALHLGETTFPRFNEKLGVAAGEGIHRGITGILANRLSEHFHAPALVASFCKDTVVGSIRSPGYYSTQLLLKPLEGIITTCGGHEFASGFTIQRSLWEQFLDRLEIEVDSIPNAGLLTEDTIMIDAELPSQYFIPETFKTVKQLEPYGEGNEPLLFLSQGIKVAEAYLFGKRMNKHCKYILDTGKYKWSAIIWKVGEKDDMGVKVGDVVDLIFSFRPNWFKGIMQVEISVLDMDKSVKI